MINRWFDPQWRKLILENPVHFVDIRNVDPTRDDIEYEFLKIGYKYVLNYPPRLEHVRKRLICQDCRESFLHYWTEDRIWFSMPKRYWKKVMCTNCFFYTLYTGQEYRPEG